MSGWHRVCILICGIRAMRLLVTKSSHQWHVCTSMYRHVYTLYLCMCICMYTYLWFCQLDSLPLTEADAWGQSAHASFGHVILQAPGQPMVFVSHCRTPSSEVSAFFERSSQWVQMRVSGRIPDQGTHRAFFPACRNCVFFPTCRNCVFLFVWYGVHGDS